MNLLIGIALAIVAIFVAFAYGYYIGWSRGHNSLPEPTTIQVAEYMASVIELEDYDVRVRRNEAMLIRSGRRAMPRGNPGPPAKMTRMQIRNDGRSTR